MYCNESGHTNVECSYTTPQDFDLFYYVPNISTSVNLHITLKGAGGGTDNGNACTPGSGAKIVVELVGASPGKQYTIKIGEQGWTNDDATAIGGGGAAVGN
jgi:hypothetical protein